MAVTGKLMSQFEKNPIDTYGQRGMSPCNLQYAGGPVLEPFSALMQFFRLAGHTRL
jgi:hypothetical protein